MSTVLMISTLLQVYNMANLSVSWIRRRDSHILTVDTETFISDPRFAASVRYRYLIINRGCSCSM